MVTAEEVGSLVKRWVHSREEDDGERMVFRPAQYPFPRSRGARQAMTMSAAEVIACYADRWAIEDTFKNTKQFLGGQQPQTFKGKGPERAAGLSLWLYSMVWLWYLKQKSSRRYFFEQDVIEYLWNRYQIAEAE